MSQTKEMDMKKFMLAATIAGALVCAATDSTYTSGDTSLGGGGDKGGSETKCAEAH